jgi:hypothetical protein
MTHNTLSTASYQFQNASFENNFESTFLNIGFFNYGGSMLTVCGGYVVADANSLWLSYTIEKHYFLLKRSKGMIVDVN